MVGLVMPNMATPLILVTSIADGREGGGQATRLTAIYNITGNITGITGFYMARNIQHIHATRLP